MRCSCCPGTFAPGEQRDWHKVTFSYAGSDNVRMGSYDVSYRIATRNSGLSSPKAPSTWQHTTARSEAFSAVPGGELCFTVRARDAAGNVSSYSPWRCATIPVDDDYLPTSG